MQNLCRRSFGLSEPCQQATSICRCNIASVGVLSSKRYNDNTLLFLKNAAMVKNKNILIADDDPNILQVTSFAMRKAGYEVSLAKDGRQALEIFRRDQPDLVILDILMPEMDGTDVCAKIRAESKVPIIFLSSKDDEIDRIVGLEMGGDDYVTKPFSPRELVARVKAVLRRSDTMPGATDADGHSTGKNRVTEHGRLRLDIDGYRAFWDNQEVPLTATEFGLLKTIIAHPGKVYTRDELMARAYESDNIVSDRTIDSHVRNIRDKFSAVGGNPIETVHGIGYKLSS